MSRTTLVPSVFAAVLLTASPSFAGTHTLDKLTHLTFTGPVQVPGATLDAGTYRFRLTNPETSRNVLQVLSHDGSAVYAMFHTTPDSRVEVTAESMVTFKETPAGVPPVVRTLFYGGEHRGYEFVYPPMAPVPPPVERPQPAITYAPYPPMSVPATPEAEPAPVRSTEWVPYAPSSAAAVQTELPRTATRLPWVGVGGFTLIVLGFAAALLRRHIG